MSYERVYDRIETAKCACGNGQVVRHSYMDMNDWNQERSGTYGDEIQCTECAKKYHIESYSHRINQPWWDGDGIVTNIFLVPNGKTLKYTLEPKSFIFQPNEKVMSEYTKDEINAMISDMRKNKFSTRLDLDSSKKVVSEYYYRYKKRSLPAIIDMLLSCIEDYDSFEMNHSKMIAFRDSEAKQLEENRKLYNETLSCSFPLKYE